MSHCFIKLILNPIFCHFKRSNNAQDTVQTENASGLKMWQADFCNPKPGHIMFLLQNIIDKAIVYILVLSYDMTRHYIFH